MKKNNGSVDLPANCSVDVKTLDDSQLQTVIKAATELKNSISELKATELDQATDSSKTYIITKSSESDTAPDATEITKGVKFVVDGGTYSAFGTKLQEAQTKLNSVPASFRSQTECDTLTEALEKATTALQMLLDSDSVKMGTKMNDAYVAGLVKAWLDNQTNAPWSNGIVLTPGGNKYSLPKSNTFTINEDGSETKITAYLEWSFNNTPYLKEDQDGALALTDTTPIELTDVTLTATLTSYTIDSSTQKSNLSLNVGDYKVKVGAPIATNSAKMDEAAANLTSGQTGQSFNVPPFRVVLQKRIFKQRLRI